MTTLAAALLLLSGARADEGMWLLPLLQKMNAEAMANLGSRLTPQQIYDINNTSLKDAIVQFGGGCTGEMISDKGLLVTNHHCGYGSIQGLSTPEHNYLEDGYFAMSSKDELPVPGLTVKFLVSMTDVTPVFAKVPEAAVDATRAALVKQAVADNPHCTAQVVSFYNDNVQYLIVYKIYRDVRFVGAPPASVGKFGGETDNWMWPRHTCDFSMFRVYAGKDNEPADYSEENVPLVPKKSLRVSLKGVEDGDFAMIMGYPGRTQRFQTASQLEQMIAVNDIRIAARTIRQDIMWDEMEKDPAVRLQYANKYAGSANGWKKWIGMKQAFANLSIIAREEQKEADFMAWVGKKGKRTKAYGSSLSDIKSYIDANSALQLEQTTLQESVANIELVTFAILFERAYNQEFAKNGSDAAAALQAAKAAVAPRYKDYFEPLDRREAKALISFFTENAGAISKFTEVDGQSIVADNYVDDVLFTSCFASEAAMQAVSSIETVKADPAYKLASVIIASIQKIAAAQSEDNFNKFMAGQKAFAAGLLEWKKGEPSYPDANMTMRLTYGNVKSYSPKDGVLYKHYTTLKGVAEKEDPDNYEFRVPAGLKSIYERADYGQYANSRGELPTCFLINCDITGGNSGSPVMNADGDLIGLAFDGNWESMSSDVMFEPDLQRCICVDIRYVLLMMDKYAGAGYLLNEMNIVR